MNNRTKKIENLWKILALLALILTTFIYSATECDRSQDKAARSQLDIDRLMLSEINRQLNSPGLDEITRANMRAQAAALNARIKAAERTANEKAR